MRVSFLGELPTERGVLPTNYPPFTHKVKMAKYRVEQDFYTFLWLTPQKSLLVTTTTFIYKRKTHTRTVRVDV